MKSRIIKAAMYAVVLFVVAGAGVSAIFPAIFSTQAEQGEASPRATQPIIIRKANGTGIAFHVELAVTEEQQAQGLMNRPTMQKDHGMLFLFDDVSVRSFWMRNTLIPLDLLFLDAAGQITHIHNEAQPLDETLIPSNGKALAVLEINGGLAETYGISVGTLLQHPIFSNGPT